jgi:hypothetical protein
VRFNTAHVLLRRYEPGKPWNCEKPQKRWKTTGTLVRPESREGIVVGIRHLSNGTVRYFPDGETDYRPTEHFPALLVAFDLRRKPVFVLPADVETIP